MSLNSILKKELPLRDSLKRKILFIAIVCYSLTAIVFIFGFGAYQWTIDKNGDEIIIEDIHSVTELAKEKWQGLQKYILGHSMGSFCLRQYLTQHSQEV